MFYIFRRNDGFIGAIAADDRRIADALLAPYRDTSFEILEEEENWPEARAHIEGILDHEAGC